MPGFNLEQGNDEVRGFAGAAGNVVFNGARPSSKSDSLETILMRIPARRVIRVEVGPGDVRAGVRKRQVPVAAVGDDNRIDPNLGRERAIPFVEQE